jgi:transposase
MRKVALNMKEEFQYKIIKKLVESNGNKQRAAIKLNCTVRHINRLIKKFKEGGKESFVHGNKNKEPVNKISQEDKVKILDIYCTKLHDANLRHATELLQENFDISISDTTLNSILKSHFILSPKAQRNTKRRMKKKLKALQEQAYSVSEFRKIEDKIESLDYYEAHPRRPRCAYFGELIQMDASMHQWFGDIKTHLHLAIDDATGMIVGGFFAEQETLAGYYQVLRQILTTYGIPVRFLTDRRTVFEYKLKNAPSDEEDTFTQFSYACHQLGIEIDTTSIPQAKGRIERLNGSLQSRIPVELRLKGVQSIEQANRQLPLLIKAYNDRFALPIHHSKTVFEKQPTKHEINMTLAVLSNRVVDFGHCIKFHGKHYIPTTSNGLKVFYPGKTPTLVIQSLDGQLFVNINETIYSLEEIPVRHELSKEFDDVPKENLKKRYIPSMHHPWRIGTFAAYIHEQKHRQNGANV